MTDLLRNSLQYTTDPFEQFFLNYVLKARVACIQQALARSLEQKLYSACLINNSFFSAIKFLLYLPRPDLNIFMSHLA